jgi:CheY-like chemotaxis protein
LEAIGQVAGGVAHDFNNQLTAIIGYADLLAHRAEGEQQRRYASNILESARRSAALTRQLLAFARKGQFQRAAVDVHLLVGETTDILERSIDKRIRIERELHADSAVVTGDASLLQNALLNLALNARDAMPDGGQLRFTTEAVALGRGDRAGHPPELGPGRYVTVTVSDTGCGMGEPVLARLFEPFFTTKEPGKGTGLGLAAVFGTVQRHGGAISVESRVGHGSSFRVYLPLGREAGVEEAPTRGGTGTPASGRVLVIEDEPLVREMASEILGAAGFRVETSENGRLGVEHYRRHWPEIDLVLLDLAMPEMDGAETFVWLRRLNPVARVLLCSGFSSEGDAQALLARGALGFVQKPFDQTTLVQSVSDALSAPGRSVGE